MAELVQLVGADRLRERMHFEILDVVVARRERRNARTREGDLRGGGEDHHLILRAVFDAELVEVQKRIRRIGELVDAVRVVPHDLEILRRRTQRRKAADRLVRVRNAGRVRILRHTPDALDRIVLGDELFDEIHIRAGRVHRDIDHLEAIVFRDAEMAVIARHRTEEFDLIEAAPRRAAVVAVRVAAGNHLEHHVEAGVIAEDDL